MVRVLPDCSALAGAVLWVLGLGRSVIVFLLRLPFERPIVSVRKMKNRDREEGCKQESSISLPFIVKTNPFWRAGHVQIQKSSNRD
jgi:hypothetical protein